jgi:hypothetical protein
VSSNRRVLGKATNGGACATRDIPHDLTETTRWRQGGCCCDEEIGIEYLSPIRERLELLFRTDEGQLILVERLV